MPGIEKVFDDELGGIGGNGESDTDETAGLLWIVQCGVDAYDVAIDVDHRTT